MHKIPVRLTMFRLVLSGCLVLGGAAVPAWAQYDGPGAAGKKTTDRAYAVSVAAILKSPVDDRPVVLRGYLLRKTGQETYLFSDGSGEISVEIEAHDFPAQRVDEKTLVEIQGKVDADFMETPEIDVKRVAVIASPSPEPPVQP